MRALIAILLIAAAFMAATARGPAKTPATAIDDFGSDIKPLLLAAPGVAEVELLVAARRPRCRIIHVCDVHFVPLDDLARDLRDQSGTEITDAEIRAGHQAWLALTRQVQTSQRLFLRWLAQHQGVKHVFSEGLTDSDMPVYRAIINSISRNVAGDTVLRVGAAGQLMASGELDDVLPAEEEAAFKGADPSAGGTLDLHGAANDAREAAIVRRLLDSGPVAVIVLGGGHDLTEPIRRLGGGECEYLKVWVEGYPRD